MASPPDSVPRPGPGRRPTLSKQQLLDVARTIVTEHGYRGASVAAIAEAAGISNGALYRYFPSKVDLFVEVFRDVCDREMRAATRVAAEVVDPLDKLDAMLENFATRALSNPTLAWALLAEPVDPAVEEVRMEYRRTYRKGIERLLDRAVAAGTIPPQDTVITAAALLGGGNEVLAGPLSPLAETGRSAEAAIAELRRMTRGAIHAHPVGASAGSAPDTAAPVGIAPAAAAPVGIAPATAAPATAAPAVVASPTSP